MKRCCESNTLLLSSTDSLDELHLSQQLDHVSSPRVEGGVLSFVFEETDAVTHAHHC